MDNGKLPALREGDTALIGDVIAELMRPVLQSFAKILENNTAALEQLSAAQQVQSDRLEALEKQIRLQTPITAKQAGYLNEAFRKRARELLDKRGVSDRKAIMKLSGAVRRAVLSRYGIAGIRELPRHEYSVAMEQAMIWNDVLAVMDAVREAGERDV